MAVLSLYLLQFSFERVLKFLLIVQYDCCHRRQCCPPATELLYVLLLQLFTWISIALENWNGSKWKITQLVAVGALTILMAALRRRGGGCWLAQIINYHRAELIPLRWQLRREKRTRIVILCSTVEGRIFDRHALRNKNRLTKLFKEVATKVGKNYVYRPMTVQCTFSFPYKKWTTIPSDDGTLYFIFVAGKCEYMFSSFCVDVCSARIARHSPFYHFFISLS